MNEKNIIAVPVTAEMKAAIKAEAWRRGLTMAGLIKVCLSSFLPENITKQIKTLEDK